MDKTRTKILVVDDENDIRQLLINFLAQEGYQASGASDAIALDQAIAQDLPDLIVLDLMLPGEDGLSICRRLQASLKIPVIMLTARSAEIDRILGLELGADDYMTKPFSKRELLARIRSVLRRGVLQILTRPKQFSALTIA